MSELLDSLWIEKYRPTTLDNLVLPEQYKFDFKKMIEKCSIPNLLFSGPQGGGKTTLAKILCSKNGVLFNRKDNMLMANGSAKKTKSINFVDSVVEPFLKYPPSGDKYKIVFIDEADHLTHDSFNSYRGIIEKYHVKYGRFIFTCNYLSRIPGPVQSRFTPYTFSQISKEFVLNYCKSILDNEKITYDEKDINFIIDQLYPDVRQIVNNLQKSSWDKKLKFNKKDIITKEKIITSTIIEIISFIEKKETQHIGRSVNSLIELLSANQDLEYRSIYTNLFFNPKIPAPAKIIINRESNKHQNCLIPHMHFMGMVFEIIKALMDFMKARS